MKKLLLLIPLILFFACNNQPEPTTEPGIFDSVGTEPIADTNSTYPVIGRTERMPGKALRMSAIAPSGEHYDILANGDSIFYKSKDSTVAVPYTYKFYYNELHPKNPTPPVNRPPVANAGSDIVLTLPANKATLDGTASTDPDNNITSYGWRKVSGPSGSTIQDSNKAIATIGNLRKGTYVYELRVVDAVNAFTADRVTVTVNDEVNPPTNQPPTARIQASATTITLPTNTVNLSAAASTDPDGSIQSWLWIKTNGPPVGSIGSSTSQQTAVSGLTTAGTYTYQLTVTDNQGAKGTASINITVNPAVNPPDGEPIPLSFIPIPTSDPDLNRPGAGVEQWHNFNSVNVPTEGVNTPRLDVYFRSPLTWAKIEKSKNNYDWSPVIAMLNNAISKKQKITIGLMSVYHDNEDGVISYDGGMSAYPQYLHQEMQSESVKDWKTSDGGWVPNYNSGKYIDAQRRINTSLNNLLETGSNNGVKYKDIINSIDVRGYGNYGEWHNGGLVDVVSQIPSAAHATTASLKAIIDAHTQTIPNFQLSIIMTAFDANWLQHTKTSPEVAYYALTTSNAYGKLGWRRDNWGATDDYIKDLLERNTRTWNGVQLNSLIMNVWKYAPVTGEPMNTAPNEYGDFKRQVELYHGVSFGNGNINQSITTGVKNNVRAASKAAGYRLAPVSGELKIGSGSMSIKMTWSNSGLTPTYENWQVMYDVTDGSGVKKSFVSQFKPRLFMGTTTVTDVINTTGLSGNLQVSMRVSEPYRGNMPLFIKNKNSDNSVTLKTSNQ